MKKMRLNYREALTRRLIGLRSCYILDAGTGAGSMTKALSDNVNAPVISIDVNRRVFPYVYGRVDRKKGEVVKSSEVLFPSLLYITLYLIYI